MASSTKLIKLILHPEDAVAGHDGVMINDTGDTIVKPCTIAELAFYDSLAQHEDFLEITPTFMGHVQLSTQDEKDSLSNPDPMSVGAALQFEMSAAQEQSNSMLRPQRGARLQTNIGVALGNMASGFVKPNILDVKLGKRLWADDAPQEKKDKLDRVSAATTSGSMGMRIAGMRVWHPAGRHDLTEGHVTKDKDYGKSLSESTILQAFREFFCDLHTNDGLTLSDERQAVVQLCEDQLARIQTVLEKNETRMYSSSVLFVFEGDGAALTRAFNEMARMKDAEQLGQDAEDAGKLHVNEQSSVDDDDDDDDDEEAEQLPRIFEAKLIDFAHAEWVRGRGADDNVLVGIRNMRNLLKQLAGE